MKQVNELDQQARQALAEGNKLVARGYWRRASRIAPDRLDIWTQLLEITEVQAERVRCLEQIVRIDAENKQATQELARINAELEEAEKEAAQAAAEQAAAQETLPADALEQGSKQSHRPFIDPAVTPEMQNEWSRAAAAGEPLFCTNHPNVETVLRCNSCGKPICPRCVVRTPVGFRCRECINAQQSNFYTARMTDYAIAAVVTLVLAVPAAVIAGLAGWWFTLVISPLAGGIIAGIVHWSVGRRRGRWTWLVVAISIAIATMSALMVMPRAFLPLGIHVFMTIGAAISVLRLREPK